MSDEREGEGKEGWHHTRLREGVRNDWKTGRAEVASAGVCAFISVSTFSHHPNTIRALATGGGWFLNAGSTDDGGRRREESSHDDVLPSTPYACSLPSLLEIAVVQGKASVTMDIKILSHVPGM